ncbi:MAG: molybdenum cofactor guanylyltransferase MobA [Gammaproteobacteria bacterium]|nr:molybdenum cofactor guanylyltransferase MobA [Gammaproteobacteria bacterium]
MRASSNSTKISGLILAGGRSSRMDGSDKGLLKLLDKPMIEHVINRLKPQVEEIIISANRHLESYQKFGYLVLVDDYDDYRGPLAGISRGLSQTKSDYLLTVPCDGPLLPMDLGQRMLAAAQKEKVQAVLAFDGHYRQPTYNLIHKDLLPAINQSLENNEHKLGKWLMDNGAISLDFSDQKSAFVNVNTPDDLNLLSHQFHHPAP